MVRSSINFNFSPSTGPAILMTGGILFLLIGFALQNLGAGLLGVLLIVVGIGLSLIWRQQFGGVI